jgi:hypothetical protein
MNRYQCPKCKRNQFSSSDNKSNEPCVYTGWQPVELMPDIEEEKIFTRKVQELEN